MTITTINNYTDLDDVVVVSLIARVMNDNSNGQYKETTKVKISDVDYLLVYNSSIASGAIFSLIISTDIH